MHIGCSGRNVSGELVGKRLLVLGGTRINCEIVRAARDLGLTVGVADYYPAEQSPGKQIADESYLVSAVDAEAVANLVRDEGFDGILTGFTDSLLASYARACELAGLPCYGTADQFAFFTDKGLWKRAFEGCGIPVVEGYDAESLLADPSRAAYPVLLKPSDASGSRGVGVCRSAEGYAEAYGRALSFSKRGKVLAERYMELPEVTAFWVFEDGMCRLAALADRHMRADQPGVLPLPVGYTFPSRFLERYERCAAPAVGAMLREWGVRDGMMFLQCFVDCDKFRIYDIGFRPTGSLEYAVLERACGYNPLKCLIRHAVTGEMSAGGASLPVDPRLGGAWGYNVSRLMRPGRIGRMEGIGELSAVPGVAKVFASYIPGEELPSAALGELRQIAVRVIGVASSLDAMLGEVDVVQRLVRVFSDEGVDLLLPGLDTSACRKAYAAAGFEEGR